MSYEGMVDNADEVRSSNSRARNRYTILNDEALITALKNEEAGAFLEIVKRYQALVYRYAGQLGVPQEEQREWGTDLITDVVLSLVKPGAIMPGSLGSYFARACRNKAYMVHRARSRRQRHESDASTNASDDVFVVESVCSEDMLRAARGAGAAVPDTPGALKRFAHQLASLLTDEEKQMLDWSSEAVPLRVIAEWQGITRDVAAHRISRLRSRLRKLAPAIIDKFDQSDREAIRKILREV